MPVTTNIPHYIRAEPNLFEPPSLKKNINFSGVDLVIIAHNHLVYTSLQESEEFISAFLFVPWP